MFPSFLFSQNILLPRKRQKSRIFVFFFVISAVLMIDNVAEEATPEQIQSLFSPFGTIVSCRLYKQGIVQLSFKSHSSAERALNVILLLLLVCV